MKLVMSWAHDWYSVGNSKELVCSHCGVKTTTGEWRVPRCRLHYEMIDSGFFGPVIDATDDKTIIGIVDGYGLLLFKDIEV